MYGLPQPGRKGHFEDFKALISPAAMPYLEEMAQLSHRITQKRFGKTIQMYAPMYLSNECQNICTYCAFSLDNKIKRKTLGHGEILLETAAVKAMGYDHILLVTGEANKTVGSALPAASHPSCPAAFFKHRYRSTTARPGCL